MRWDNNWSGTANGMGWDATPLYYGMGCNNKYDAVSQWQCENSNAYCIVAVDRFIRDIIHSCMHSSLFVWTPQVYVRLSIFVLSVYVFNTSLLTWWFLFILLSGYGSFSWDMEQSNRVIKWDWDQIDIATGFTGIVYGSRSKNNDSLILQ